MVQAAARIARYDPLAIIAHAAGGGDLLKPLYESLFPRAVRHALGEYYTPHWLAEHVLDQVGYHGQAGARLLDPTCGSGTFLLAALAALAAKRTLVTLPDPLRGMPCPLPAPCSLLPAPCSQPHGLDRRFRPASAGRGLRSGELSLGDRRSAGAGSRRSTCRSSPAMPSSTSRRTRPPLISSSAIRPGLPGTTCPAIIARPRSRTGSATACSRFPATRRGMAAARRTCRCSCCTRSPIATWPPRAGWAW